MRYEIFYAPTLGEAVAKAVSHFGRQAYIISKEKCVKKKLFGLKKEVYYKVTAAHNETPDETRRRLIGSEKNKESSNLETSLNWDLISGSRSAARPFVPPLRQEGNLNEVKAGILRKAEMLKKRSSENGDGFAAVPGSDRPSGISSSGAGMNRAARFLIAYDFSEEFASAAAAGFENIDPSESAGKEALAKKAAGLLSYSGDVKIYETGPNLVFFIGPTGVGKTTTIAKITARYVIKKEIPCVMATYDCFRLMAIAQLEKYASIMGIPFFSLQGQNKLPHLLEQERRAKLVFVDTFGVSRTNEKHVSELTKLINEINSPREIHLCVNASQRRHDLEKVFEKFSGCGYDRVCITKTDESWSLGTVLSAAAKYKTEISYLSNGQDVPDNLILADQKAIAAMLLKEWTNG